MDDMDLVREYVSHGSEEAFAALVSRHIGMVYSVALRQVGNPDNAREVTQAVFIILARKSRSLRRETVISGWLFHAARLTAANFLRSETRRVRREQGAYMQSNLHGEGDDAWKQIAPLLNDAIASLGEKDRNAIVLRYLEGRNLAEVGAALGASEDAAKKRLARAVEKLRIFFHDRRVTFPTAILTACLAAKSVEATPAGLAATVTAAVLKGTALTASTSTLVTGTLKFMAWTKIKIGIIAGTAAALVAIQSYEIASQNKQLTLLRAQLLVQSAKPETEAPQAGKPELEQLQMANTDLGNEVLKLRGQLASIKPGENQHSQSDIKLSQEAAQNNAGRQLGLAVAQGDPAALGKLSAMATAELQFFNTNNVGMNDTDRGELARRAFAPLQAAFDAIVEEAAKGNRAALQGISSALQMPELAGHAVQAAGILAGNGDEMALQILLNPKDYGLLPSAVVGALRPAAESGNQKAIDALAAVVTDQSQQTLWFMAAEGLGTAAASGNPTAVDALIALSGDTNPSIRSSVIASLQRASANQSTKAADTLRQMRTH